MVIRQRAQVNLIGDEVNGVVEIGEEAKEGIWDVEDLVVETLVGYHLVEIGVVGRILGILILLLATGEGAWNLARDYPNTSMQSSTSGSSSSTKSTFKSGQSGPRRGRGRGRLAQFSGMNVLYDDKGNEYPIDDASQLYVPLGFEQTVVEDAKEETEKSTKN